jgi:hypothetical protein
MRNSTIVKVRKRAVDLVATVATFGWKPPKRKAWLLEAFDHTAGPPLHDAIEGVDLRAEGAKTPNEQQELAEVLRAIYCDAGLTEAKKRRFV